MGTLRSFNLADLMERYGTRVFVETGTGRGDSLRYACGFAFERLYSVEIVAAQARRLQDEFSGDPRVVVESGESVRFLQRLLPALRDVRCSSGWMRTTPGGDLGLNAFDAEPDADLRLPLDGELESIHRLRPWSEDVILIDDLRIYESGPFGGGNLAGSDLAHLSRYEGAGFVERLFGGTHEMTRRYDETGYLILLPRGKGG